MVLPEDWLLQHRSDRSGPREFASHEVPAAGEILFAVGSQISSPSTSRSLICRGKVDESVTSAAVIEHRDQHSL